MFINKMWIGLYIEDTVSGTGMPSSMPKLAFSSDVITERLNLGFFTGKITMYSLVNEERKLA